MAHEAQTHYAGLPPELLQLVGDKLSPPELRSARLTCKPWATSLAHCMPAVTVALPRQASDHIFRQPLVLCSSGVLNSAQCQDYRAVPKALGARASAAAAGPSGSGSSASSSSSSPDAAAACPSSSAGGEGARPAAALVATGACCGAPAADPADADAAGCSAFGDAAQCVSRDKPSPFATELGQSVLDCLGDPLLLAAAAGPALAAAAAGPALPCPGAPPSPTAGMLRRPRPMIQGAISMPPALAGQALACQQQQEQHGSQQPPAHGPSGADSSPLALHQQAAAAASMRKLSSVPAGGAQPLPRPRLITRAGAGGAQPDAPLGAAAGQPQHVVTAALAGPAIQGWSSLPTAGLRTCSSLRQLQLKLSGQPPSPADLLDLSRLVHLTHLSFKQIDLPEAEEDSAGESEDGSSTGHLSTCFSGGSASGSTSTAGCSRSASSTEGQLPCGSGAAAAAAAPAAAAPPPPAADAYDYETLAQVAAAALGRMSMDGDELSSPAAAPASPAAAAAAAASASRRRRQQRQLLGWERSGHGPYRRAPAFSWDGGGRRDGDDDVAAAARQQRDQWVRSSVDGGSTSSAAAAVALGGRAPGEGARAHLPAHSLSCSVITASHVEALARLPHLCSLELSPKLGAWDEAGKAGLLQLSRLSCLTRLSITWGDAAAAAAPLGGADAAAAARGDALPLQRCLALLRRQLRELELNGAPVVDVAVLQGMQRLRRLTGEGLKVVDADLGALLQQPGSQQQQQQQLEAQPPQQQQQQPAPHQQLPLLGAAAQPPPQQQQQQPGAAAAAAALGGSVRWAALPELEYVHAVHPAADISYLLQATVTPQLAHLGFVTRGPSDFARLLGQHGKLRVLHLAFAEEEAWHPIAVVRLPTALPSLRSLTLEGNFWLPNSLIVALGVMEVPLEHLSLTCRLAPPCLQRLQHLRRLKRLALHHVPAAWPPGGGGAPHGAPQRGPAGKQRGGGGQQGDAMLQLPAKLLPPQLQELEISNGWIQH